MDPVLAFQPMRYLVFAVGIVFLAIGGSSVWRQYGRQVRSVSVDGRTVDVHEERRWVTTRTTRNNLKEHRIVYMAIVEFTALDGSTHRIADTLASTTKPVLGAVCPIRYDPNHPGSAFVASRASIWLAPSVFAGFGVLLLFLAQFLV